MLLLSLQNRIYFLFSLPCRPSLLINPSYLSWQSYGCATWSGVGDYIGKIKAWGCPWSKINKLGFGFVSLES